MKRLIWALAFLLVLPIVVSADVDLSGMSFSELVALRDQLNLAIWNSADWQEVTVPQGLWEVGKDIPEGHWSISPLPGSYTYIVYGDTLEEGGKSVSYSSKNRFYESLHASDSLTYNPSTSVETIDLVLCPGSYVEISNGKAVFTPYSGNQSFSFSRPGFTAPAEATPAPTAVPLVDGRYELFNFKKAARMPEEYTYTSVYLNGEVVQVLGSRKDGYTLRVSTNGSYGDVILVYVSSSVAPEYSILDDDQLYIKGWAGGEYTYESTAGTEITVPLVYADFVEILDLK